ncbi:ATP-grasp fold amidoligase family protein [Bacillus cereus group sp. Bc015]|uniref:ATP-grasp fold amidoligase family protein n=1 Tax=Bacillus cereus group sp. Bc015 TaxID=3018123 RepID=UPI0022E3C19E|nr:ATP-grasp fold amidoligase family protein [Bacillus cereus group sp. Bc015]MDA2736500.1 ATP-grasp fold amidoligase family protein [Bacillus cereus group sp. Bc015]
MNSFLKSTLRNNEFIVDLYDSWRQFYYQRCITKEKIIKGSFKKSLGREVELDNPVKFNDKLQWLKLNWFDSDAIKCADKFGVREFVKEKIGEKYLNDIYGVYESVDEINIDILPNSFVLKGTHGSGFNIVCRDKSKMDWDKEFKKMRRWLKTNYYLRNLEWVYKGIKPRIICERFIEQEGGAELRDYRFFCFNGEPKFISIDFSINDKKKTRRNLYDLEWNLMDQEISYPRELSIKVNKPNKLDEMLELSKKLSASFPHARVDFYYIEEEIIFGEITFFHQSGMGEIRPLKFEEEMGKWLKLPNEKFQ